MDKKLKVAVYCRFERTYESVSHEKLEKYYKEFISTNKNWELCEIYIDKGFEATKTSPRLALNSLFNNCRNGKFDIIVTKDTYRIYKNPIDMIEFMEELRALNPPVRVLFEDDGWFVKSSAFKKSLRDILELESVKMGDINNGI